ncbi:MAG: hypothetical protein IPO63_00770 [Bacteroidetes bacterium]|nr:hypothetical protein [Bacteroidota bacterium]
MKNKAINFMIVAMLMTGTIITGCQSPKKKEENADAKVQDAITELNEAEKEAAEIAKKTAETEEWKTFKVESQEKIRKNEERIAELKVKKQKSGKLLDPLYEKRIETLEQKNKELNAKLNTYEKEPSDWETFKREFNHDIDELGQALKDFTVDNKK